MEMAMGTQGPTITVKGAKGVTIRGLRVRGSRTGNPGSVNTNETLVLFDGAAGATLSDSAIVGPFSNGVTITNGSDVHIEKSLIAAMWGTGVQASGAKVHLADSDIRNCHHRCITLSGEGSVIERSRISGSAWHGIRYDGCSPTISGNLIFGNARSGIYASGNTAANVRGNVFWRNEMDGMSCWFNNADDVEGNTFVANQREGIAVLGDSETKLTKNVFAGSPIAVFGGGIAGRNNQTVGTPKPSLVSNVFWDNQQDFEVSKEAKPLPAGNEKEAPRFVSVEKGNFSLADDSPVRRRGAGAAEALPAASPFPITPEETAMIPDGETRDFAKWKKPAEAEAKPAAAKEGPTSNATTTVKSASTTAATPAQLARERENAKVRMQQDRRRFPKDDLADAERLYQVANKNWRSAEARESLKTMVSKYPDFNRTGCALLYLGQMAEGNDRESYLTDAIKHGDCYYGNGVQVGAFARYVLGHTYLDQGKKAEAQKLFDEIRANYSNALTHSGDSLVAVMREEGQAMKAGTQPAE
jgi:TolA-binding protein